MNGSLDEVLEQVRACRVCEAYLPLGPRPVVQIGERARIVIVGQAPGTKVHQSGIPWRDASGDHLREWMAVDNEQFYDRQSIALVPMGFCYPGAGNGGDAPPRPECAPLWHPELLGRLAEDVLMILVGQYAIKHYLGPRRAKTLTETVRAFDTYLPRFFPLPHSSWRSKLWMKKNEWFERDVLPALRQTIWNRLNGSSK